MNDLYNETVTRNGRIYHYDPDHDIYYSRSQPLSKWDRFGWLAVIVILAAIALYFEFSPIR